MISGSPSIEHVLAGFAVMPLSLPDEVRAAGLRSLLNVTGTAIGGGGEPAIEKLVGLLSAFGGAPTSTIVGRSERADMLWAAYINAAAANIFDFDDTHIPTVIHPSAPVAPALLAWAEAEAAGGRAVSGKALLEAFIVGVEVTCRLGLAAGASHYSRGWHITSTCGAFGAALACGRLMGLSQDALVDALGNAFAQSAGSVETLGTMSKSLSVGQASRGGLMAALLAGRGYTGPRYPLTGARGFFELYCDNPEPARLTAKLGEDWEILNNTFKPYPCGVVLNPVVEACLELHAEGGFVVDDIVEVRLTGHPLLRQRTDRPNVTSGRLSQVSAQHAVAVSLLAGHADIQAFSDESVADPALRAFGAKLRFHDDTAFALESAEVRLVLIDGRHVVRKVSAARGGLEKPMTDADLAQKLRSQVEWRGLSLSTDRLVSALQSLESAEDGAAFLALTRPL